MARAVQHCIGLIVKWAFDIQRIDFVIGQSDTLGHIRGDGGTCQNCCCLLPNASTQSWADVQGGDFQNGSVRGSRYKGDMSLVGLQSSVKSFRKARSHSLCAQLTLIAVVIFCLDDAQYV